MTENAKYRPREIYEPTKAIALSAWVRAGISLLTVAGMLSLSTPAAAAGFGLVTSYNFSDGGATEVDDDDELDVTNNGFGIGAMFDTNVSRDKLFNYRIEIDLGYSESELNTTEGTSNGIDPAFGKSKFDMFTFNLVQTVGFGFVRTRNFRLFVGPTLRLGVNAGSGTPSFGGRGCLDCEKVDIVQVEFGVGPTLGANYNVGDKLTLTGSLSYLAQLHLSQLDDPNRPYDGGQTDYSYLGFTNGVMLRFGVMFRTASDIFDR